MLAKLRSIDVTPPARDWCADDFRQAREAYRAMVAERAALLGEKDDLRALTVWLAATDSEREGNRYRWARERIEQRWPDGKLPKERTLPEMARDIEDRLEDCAPAWQAAEIAWATARVKEANRVAKALQPRQRRAVNNIASALSTLSAAVAEATELEAEFREQSPMRESPYFIDCTRELVSFAPLGVYDSSASVWLRRMKSIGVI